MRSFKNRHAERDATAARNQLVQEFPRLSTRIIDTVLDAYRDLTPSVPAALRAARARIRDACAP